MQRCSTTGKHTRLFQTKRTSLDLYKAPQWNTRYPNSWGCGPRPLFAGLVQRDGLPGQNLNMVLTIITTKTITQYHFIMNNFQIIRQQLNRLLNALQTY
jgi:hypothetical protein